MIVDASIWISAFIRNDVFHRRSRVWLRTQRNAGLVVPSLAFVEVAGAVARVQGNPERARRMSRWLRVSTSIEVIELTPMLMTQAADIAATHRLRGADAIYVAAALDRSIPLVTWDVELQQRAAAIVDVIQP